MACCRCCPARRRCPCSATAAASKGEEKAGEQQQDRKGRPRLPQEAWPVVLWGRARVSIFNLIYPFYRYTRSSLSSSLTERLEIKEEKSTAPPLHPDYQDISDRDLTVLSRAGGASDSQPFLCSQRGTEEPARLESQHSGPSSSKHAHWGHRQPLLTVTL